MDDMVKRFIEAFGEDFFQQLCEAAWAQKNIPDVVHFDEHYMIDACNYVHQGTFWRDGVEYRISLEQGNRKGLTLQWGEDIDITPPVRSRFVFAPRDQYSEAAQALFQCWQGAEWFNRKQDEMNYDLMFDPTIRTRDHYEAWARQKGMIIEVVQVEETGT